MLNKTNLIVSNIICLLFMMLFIYAALEKVLDYQKFVVQLQQSPVLTSFAHTFAWLVPVLEIIITILLIVPAFKLTGLYASFGLMISFSAYIIAITRFSEYIPCACGGIFQDMGWKQHLVFNISFSIIALLGVLLFPFKTANDTNTI